LQAAFAVYCSCSSSNTKGTAATSAGTAATSTANAAKRVQVYGLEASQFGPWEELKELKELAKSEV